MCICMCIGTHVHMHVEARRHLKEPSTSVLRQGLLLAWNSLSWLADWPASPRDPFVSTPSFPTWVPGDQPLLPILSAKLSPQPLLLVIIIIIIKYYYYFH